MASKAKGVLHGPIATAERLLWEKYNKPNRNLFQALSAFEGNGVGRKVVCAHPFRQADFRIATDLSRCRSAGKRRDSRIATTQ